MNCLRGSELRRAPSGAGPVRQASGSKTWAAILPRECVCVEQLWEEVALGHGRLCLRECQELLREKNDDKWDQLVSVSGEKEWNNLLRLGK